MGTIANLFISLYQDVLNFYNSFTFSVIKFILGIYTAVLVIDIVLLLFQRGLKTDFREGLLGINVPKELIKNNAKFKLKWDNIAARLESGNESEYKVAVIEADNIIDDLIKRMGYKGDNMKERMESIPVGHFDNLEKIKAAHEVRNRIIHEEDFSLKKDEAKKILNDYADFLRTFEAID